MIIRLLLLTCLVVLFLIANAPAQKVVKVDFAKKIADATPEALPQSPIEKRPSTDARDDGIKGKVKSVIEYTVEAGRVKRELYAEKYYNENGNLIRSVSYGEGYPDSVVVYGYVDGMRVRRSGDIEYAKGEKPLSKQIVVAMNTDVDTDAQRDPRYRMREVRKYDDQNRLIEEASYQNNGQLSSRTTFTYEGNVRIERGFFPDGQEISKTRETLDASGDVIEQLMYGADDEPPSRYTMKHQLDSQGNWIVEQTYEEKTVRKRKITKLLWTSYRTIEYYP